MTEVAWKREYLFTAKCSSASSGCGFMQDVTPPAHTGTHRPPPIFLISTLTLQSPGLIRDGKCVIGEEGFEPGQLHCARGWVWIRPAGSSHSMPSCPAWPCPAWPGPQMVSKSTQVTELKQCETLGLYHVAKNTVVRIEHVAESGG